MDTIIKLDRPFEFGGNFNTPIKNDQLFVDWIDNPEYPTIILNNVDLNTLTIDQLKKYVEKIDDSITNKEKGILITFAGRADGYKCFFDYRQQ